MRLGAGKDLQSWTAPWAGAGHRDPGRQGAGLAPALSCVCVSPVPPIPPGVRCSQRSSALHGLEAGAGGTADVAAPGPSWAVAVLAAGLSARGWVTSGAATGQTPWHRAAPGRRQETQPARPAAPISSLSTPLPISTPASRRPSPPPQRAGSSMGERGQSAPPASAQTPGLRGSWVTRSRSVTRVTFSKCKNETHARTPDPLWPRSLPCLSPWPRGDSSEGRLDKHGTKGCKGRA